MTARKIWEYRPEVDIFSVKVGNIVRLPNGNTMVNVGFRSEDPSGPAVLVEARPDGSTAWWQELTLRGTIATRYRAMPLDSLAGERSVQPTVSRLP